MKRFYLVITAIVTYFGLLVPTSQGVRSYWQQDVSYKMDVELGADGRTLSGHLDFNYRNNSPDTLKELRFHAHYNSFQPGSPAHRRWHDRGSRRIENAPEEDYGSLIVSEIRDGKGRLLRSEFNYSIFEVQLAKPLLPGSEVELSMDFESYIPGRSVAYRSAFAHGQLKCAHWYPQVCVYDHVMGWVDNQYQGTGEAYGEFGTYEVNLTLPEPYIVGATGNLVNRGEVLPDSLRKLLNIDNYLEQPREASLDTAFGNWTNLKTWRFRAENVHDFAWVADPLFRIDQDRCGETDIWILVREDNISDWYDAAEVTREGMEILEREIGPFPYPEFTVADCFSGMEYPGIVFCSGYSPRYKLLFWHEMAHNYFMGALGFNQTDRSFLDEGFTTYWEIRMMEELLGMDNIFLERRGSLVVMDINRWYRGFRPYLQRQKSGYILPLHLESDLPEVYMQYRVSSYYKPATMLFALQNFIGEEGIRRVMHDFYGKWKFKHPYEGDFLTSLEETLGTSMEWFYDAWVRGSKSLDYSITKVGAKKPDIIGLRICREGDMILPVKVAVEDASGDLTCYYIPLNSEPTPPDCAVRLPRWDQRRDPHNEYIFEVEKRNYLKAELDPQGMLADVNPLNNTTSWLPPMKWEFDYPFRHMSPVDAYRIRWAPTLFYNGIDGLQGGVYFKGDYLERWSKVRLAARLGALTGRVSAELDYDDSFSFLGRGSNWGLSAYTQEGHRGGEIRINHEEKKGFDERVLWEGGLKWYMHELFDREYPPSPELWEDGLISALALNGSIYPRIGRLAITASSRVEGAAPLGDFAYSLASMEFSTDLAISQSFSFKLRGFFGSASEGTPFQNLFGLGGGGPLLQTRNPWLRSWASVPPDWNGRAIGEGNLSGYSTGWHYSRNVTSLQAKLSYEVRFLDAFLLSDLPTRYQPVVNAFIFAGTGETGSALENLNLENRVSEAGWGISFRLPSSSELELSFPIYLSDPMPDEDSWQWRTMVGFSINK